MGLHAVKRTAFAAKMLAPMVEASLASGKPLHVIHDKVPTLPLEDGILENFEAIVASRRFMMDLNQQDRGWRFGMKGRLASVQEEDDAPEMALIREANRNHPGAIISHLGFYPMEAAIELSRARVNNIAAIKLACRNDYKGAIRHIMLANDAFANAVLLRDMELPRQVSKIGSDAVVFRSMAHVYLAQLDKSDIPICVDGRAITLAQLYERHSISLEGEIEDTELIFDEIAINKLCLGHTDAEEHKALAFMQTLFLGYMANNGLWDAEKGIDKGVAATNRAYAKCIEKAQPQECL
jgi:hypothetical protein